MFRREEIMFKSVFGLLVKFLVYSCLWKKTGCNHVVLPECHNCDGITTYEDCRQNKSLIDPNDDHLKYEQSLYARSVGIRFDAGKLPFSKYSAWCINKQASKDNLFKQWASVKFSKSYIVYKLKVRGFRNEEKSFDDQYLPKTFKLEYSRDSATWFSVAGGVEFDSVKASMDGVSFSPPILLSSVRIRMRLDPTEAINTCIKLEVYGCEAVPVVSSTTTSEPSTSIVSTTVPTPPPVSIASYSIKQGDSYNTSLSFLDTEYEKQADVGGILRDGLGCLIDEETVKSPFVNPFCWIGWDRNSTEKPFLLIKLPSKTNITGFQLIGFNGMEAGIIQNMTIKVSDNKQNYTLIGYACPENEMKNIINYKVNLKHIRAESIEILFTYSKPWILLRKLVLYQDDISHMRNVINVSPTLVCDKGVKIPRKQDSSSHMVPIILGVVIGLSVFVLIIIAIVYFKFFSTRRPKMKGKETQRESILL